MSEPTDLPSDPSLDSPGKLPGHLATEQPLSDALREAIAERFNGFKPIVDLDAEHTPAAVALMVLDVAGGADVGGLPRFDPPSVAPALLLTRRSRQLRKHAGQWALPGGRLDPGETVEQAALRELSEEVGVHLAEEAVLGRLDDFVTRSGFIMSPIVVWGGRDLELTPEPGEVASTHRIPFSEFNRDDAPRLEDSRHGEHPVLHMPIGNDHIAAPTAAILYQFREVVIRGLATRVAHYEQPDFAWK